MARFSVDIEKLLLGEYWTNRYVVEDADLAQAVITGNIIYEAERQIHANNVLFTKYRVSDFNPLTDVYQIVNLNTMGLREHATAQLPLFNVCRVDFNVAGGGRPSRKYLRMPLQESDSGELGALAAGTIADVMTNYATPLVDLVAYVDVDGQSIISASVWPFIGMRQLRRGSKRRLEPILP